MRKTLAAVVALLALTVAACGASGGNDNSDKPTTTKADKSTTSGGDKTTTTEDATTTTEDQTTTTDGGGGPDGAVPVETWAGDFCGSFTAWIGNIKDASSSVNSGGIDDIETAKTAIVDLFGTASSETQSLISDIDAAGVPDIPDGDQLVQDLQGKFQDFDDAILTAQSDAEALDTSDPATFQTNVTELITRFQTETKTVGDSFGELDAKYPSPEFQQALSSNCDL